MVSISKNSFARIITLLRKEKNISQKQVAMDLGISQALLSHYEKGIRECKLDFVIKVADYYNVSIDYLLGRAPERNGLMLHVDDIPEEVDDNKNKVFRGSILATLNKKLISNSINIIFDILQKINNKALIKVISAYLSVSVYKMFRVIFSVNSKNPTSFFSLDEDLYKGLTSAEQSIAESQALFLADGKSIGELHGLSKKQKESIALSSEKLSADYPLFSSSLSNLIKNVEKNVNDSFNN